MKASERSTRMTLYVRKGFFKPGDMPGRKGVLVFCLQNGHVERHDLLAGLGAEGGGDGRVDAAGYPDDKSLQLGLVAVGVQLRYDVLDDLV